MKLKNILIVVEDIEKSKKFYHDLFHLDLILDQDGNVILTEGLVLQQKVIWKRFLGKEIIEKSNSCELYFEEPDLEGFVEKLDRLYPSVQYVNRLMTHSWGQKVVRFYDLDGNLIEVGTPMQVGRSYVELAYMKGRLRSICCLFIFRSLFLYDRKLRPIIQKRSARKRQGTFFFVLWLL